MISGEMILTILVSFTTSVIIYVLKENNDLKKENRFLMSSLLVLTTAIEHTDTIQDNTVLHQTALDIKNKLKERLDLK